MRVVGCPLVTDGEPAQATVALPREGGAQPGHQPQSGPSGLGRPVPAPCRADPARRVGAPGRTPWYPRWFPDPVSGAEQIVAPGDRWARGRRRCKVRAALAPVLASGVGGSHHLGRPEHHRLRPDHARHGEGAGRARCGRLPGRHRGRRHERAAVVAPRLRTRGCPCRRRSSSRSSRFPGAPGPVPVVTRHDFGPTGFTAAHLGRLELHRWHTPAGLVTAGCPR